jgi:pentatricopeptide repeat protein
LKWLKGLCKKANEKDAEKLVDHMEKAEEKNEGN